MKAILNKEGSINLDDLEKYLLDDDEIRKQCIKDKTIDELILIFLKYRKQNKLTQKDLAEKLGTTQQAVSRLEKNMINPSLEFITKSLYEMGYEIKFKKIK